MIASPVKPTKYPKNIAMIFPILRLKPSCVSAILYPNTLVSNSFLIKYSNAYLIGDRYSIA